MLVSTKTILLVVFRWDLNNSHQMVKLKNELLEILDKENLIYSNSKTLRLVDCYDREVYKIYEIFFDK